MKVKMKLVCLTSLILLLMNWPASSTPTPTPSPWPEQFHALLYMNLSDAHLQLSDLWYDWPKGRNVNIFQRQLGEILYDIEWDNGTSYYYTLGPNATCRVMSFEVGIPRPDFLDDANYLGTQVTDGFLCHVWEKVDFIWYYEDVLSGRPVRWDFYDGISSHVMTFEVGAVLPDSVTQAPAYCFNQDSQRLPNCSADNREIWFKRAGEELHKRETWFRKSRGVSIRWTLDSSNEGSKAAWIL